MRTAWGGARLVRTNEGNSEKEQVSQVKQQNPSTNLRGSINIILSFRNSSSPVFIA